MRLPPLEVLRIKEPNKPEPNPCWTIMNHVLGMQLTRRRIPFPGIRMIINAEY